MTGLLSYQTNDSDEIACALTGWEQDYTQLGSGCLSAELVRVTFPESSLFFESSNLHLQQNMCPPLGQVVIGIPRYASGESLFNGQPLEGDSLLFLEGGRELEISAVGRLGMLGLCLNLTTLEQTLEASEHAMLTKAMELRKVPLSAEAAEAVRQSLASSLEAFQQGILDAECPESSRIAIASGLQKALCGVSETLDTIRIPSRNHKALAERRRLVLAAIHEMRSELASPLAVETLCERLGISERTLQYCFRQVCHTTPQQFFLALRLGEAKRRLKNSPSEAITDIAFSLGFSSSSHFSSLYKRLYGTCPSAIRTQH